MDDEGVASAVEAIIEALDSSVRPYKAVSEAEDEMRSGGLFFTVEDAESGERYVVLVGREEG